MGCQTGNVTQLGRVFCQELKIKTIEINLDPIAITDNLFPFSFLTEMLPPLLLPLLIILITVGAQVMPGTPCDDQLHSLYLSKGLSPGVGNKPVISYVTGYATPGNVSYVSALIRFGEAASQYQRFLTNQSLFVIPVSYVAFDVPLCATNITMTCVDDSEMGMDGKTNCAINDTDPGFPSLIAGRLYVHLDYTTFPCNGTINITFMNTVLFSDRFTARYVYDVTGIVEVLTPLNFTAPPLLNAVAARNQYLTSGCIDSDGSSLQFAAQQKQLVCVDKQIGCNSLNQITAVAPRDFAVHVAQCIPGQPSYCIPLNGSASNQTGTAQLFYKWRQVLGYDLMVPHYDNITCNTYTSGLFNTTSAVACVIFRFTGLYQIELTVYDNVSGISTDSVIINVVMADEPLIIPNRTIAPYPLPPPKTGPPIDRPTLQFPTPAPPAPTAEPPTLPRAPVNTTVASLYTQLPPWSNAEIASLLIVMVGCALILVIFTGFYIVMMPSEEESYLDRIYYY